MLLIEYEYLNPSFFEEGPCSPVVGTYEGVVGRPVLPTVDGSAGGLKCQS
jgi:hypothetical protein